MQDEWDSLFAAIERHEESLAKMRREFGWEPFLAPTGGKSAKPAPSREAKRTDADLRVAPGGAAEASPTRQEDVTARLLPFAVGSSWNASELILEERADAPDDEDVQCYLIRRRFTELKTDDELERMAQTKTQPASEWDESALEPSQELLYLRVEKHLADSRFSELAEQEMLCLTESGKGKEPEKFAFYPAFTLLQGAPSRQRVSEVLDALAALPAAGERSALGILRAAASEVAEELAEQSAQQLKRYRGRQAELERLQGQAQQDYNAAQRKVDRWRK